MCQRTHATGVRCIIDFAVDDHSKMAVLERDFNLKETILLPSTHCTMFQNFTARLHGFVERMLQCFDTTKAQTLISAQMIGRPVFKISPPSSSLETSPFLYETGTINLSISGASISSVKYHSSSTEDLPQPPSYASNSITFPVPLFNGTVRVLVPGVYPLVVGKNATTLVTPFTTTFAYRCVLSPFV